MHISCIAKSITDSAGIKAELSITSNYIYCKRSSLYKQIAKVKVGEKIKARVIGQRYELNDTYISIIAELIEDKAEKYGKKKPKLKIKVKNKIKSNSVDNYRMLRDLKEEIEKMSNIIKLRYCDLKEK